LARNRQTAYGVLSSMYSEYGVGVLRSNVGIDVAKKLNPTIEYATVLCET
jgi:hypothetical protein